MMENKKAAVNESGNTSEAYFKKIHRIGRLLSALAILSMFVPVIGISLVFKIKMEWGPASTAMVQVLMIFGLIGFTEFVSFSPILGAGGSYLTHITGNVTTMKLPCATTAMRVFNVQPGTREADIVTILSVGISSIMSTLICALGMVIINILYPVLSNPVLSPGFNNMVPALIGAMSAPYLIKNPRMTSLPLVLMFIATIVFGVAFVGEYDTYFNLAFMVIAAVWAYWLFKKGKINDERS